MSSFAEIVAFIELVRLSWKAAENIRTIQLLTYKEAVKYFTNERPEYPKPSSGVLIRKNSPEGIEIIQVFLDSHEEVICYPDGTPYGHILLAREIDRELKEAFGEKNMILLK